MFSLKDYLYVHSHTVHSRESALEVNEMVREYNRWDIHLSHEERQQLKRFVSKGKNPAMIVRRANVILAVDLNSGKPLSCKEAAERFGIADSSVCSIRKAYIELGIDEFLHRKVRETPPIEPKITGDVEARIIQIACSQPPAGRTRWTVRMIREKVVELEILDSISVGSVQNVLKKTRSDRT